MNSPIQLHKKFSTTVWHVLSWILYAVGAGPTAIISMGVYVPLIVMKNAHDHGFLRTDHTIPCSLYPEEPCSLNIVGPLWIDVSSIVFAASAISTFLQMAMMVSLGVICDYGNNRRYILFSCVIIGSISGIILSWSPSSFLLGKIVFLILVDLNFIISQSCYDSFLPIFLRFYPITRGPITLESALQDETNDLDSYMTNTTIDSSEEEPYLLEHSLILNESAPPADVEDEHKAKIAARLSSVGFGSFFGAAILFQIIFTPILYKTNNNPIILPITVTVCSCWWLILSTPLCTIVTLPVENHSSDAILTLLYNSVKESYHSFKHAMSISSIRLFLFSRLFINCGIQTSLSSAVIFGKARLNLSNFQLTLLGMGISSFALLGTVIIPYLTEYFQLNSLQVVMIISILLPMAPLYGLLGYIPGFENAGIRTSADVFRATLFFGFFLGGAHSYCRSVYAQLVPSGKETRFFALYALISQTGVLFSHISLTLISNYTSDLRAVYIFVIVVMTLPLSSLWIMYQRSKTPNLHRPSS